METRPNGGALGGNDASTVLRWTFGLLRRYLHTLDKTVPHIVSCWIGCLALMVLYGVRVHSVQGLSVVVVPVFWPILLFYWFTLFILTMKREILHMIKYKYLPFSFGKQRYDGKKASSKESTNLPMD